MWVAAQLGVTRSQLQRWCRAGLVTIGDAPVRPGQLLRAGETINVAVPEKLIANVPPLNLPVLYEDADMLVVDKPAGISVHRGAGHENEATVADFARLHTTDPDPDRPGIVHRLDRDTSGLLVIAKSAAAKAALQEQWQRHQVQKTYQLLAVGRVEPATATIRLPVGRDIANPLRRRVYSGGKLAVTRYRTLANYPGYTLVEARPETGRTHQLRVHFAALGHPIVGDTLYSAPRRPLGLQRQFLHATGLELKNLAGEQLELMSPLPPDLTAILKTLQNNV